jgi:polyhydroxyalkanoate synthesis regulator phasin
LLHINHAKRLKTILLILKEPHLMNSETLIQLLQNGFRVTLGATASLIEVVQDPQKREANLSKLRQEWSQLAEEWAVKGESTEQDARNFVDSVLSQRRAQNAESSSSATPPFSTPPSVQTELQELTAQIATIRAELEKLRNQA